MQLERVVVVVVMHSMLQMLSFRIFKLLHSVAFILTHTRKDSLFQNRIFGIDYVKDVFKYAFDNKHKLSHIRLTHT